MNFAKKKKKKGFTLIELLVVIAIIGILATIVIVNVNSARGKAKDTAIIGSMDSLRAAAEMAFDSSTPTSYASTCLGTTFGGTGDFARIKTGVTNQGSSISCNAAATAPQAYAAWASTTSAGGFYCVDSEGRAMKIVTAPGAGVYTCQ
jgi:prepilin-type N-terminal cleavage/methylation domain-containing protein